MTVLQRLALTGALVFFGAVQPVWAQTADKDETDTFILGTIYVTAEDPQGGTSTTVTGEEAVKSGRFTLDDTLKTVPGVGVGNSGGSRNERLIFVRGFDRLQVPLSIDGIRVYLPSDNRLDFGRFLTPDLAEVQVQKGYVSVLNGPGGMGGAINLVTKQPVEPFEGTVRLGFEAGNTGDVTGRNTYLSFGTKQELFYVQASYLRRDSDGFYLSKDYVPRPQQGAGLRDYADTDDSRVNLKFGYTPNATDEYVLSYTRQTGSKNAPYNVDQPIRGVPGTGIGSFQRDWGWPTWDVESLALYSHTDLGGAAYVEAKVYLNGFDNVLSAFDDYTHDTQTQKRAFDSVYDDSAWGASIELGGDIGAHTVKGALHYRLDRHDDTQYPTPGLGTPAAPTKRSDERTWSIALEDSWQARDDLRFVAGVSYDRADVLKANRTATDPGKPTGSSDAINWQMAAIWTPEAGGQYHASLSSRTRFPTMFNRYSTRFGTAVPNPDLDSERALNVEIGYSGDLGPVLVEGAVFYSKVNDMILSVPVYSPDPADRLTQSQNVGDGTYAGFEVAAHWEVSDTLSLKGAYTYLDRDISDPIRADLLPTDVPLHTAVLRLDWQAQSNLTISPSLEIYGSRLSDSAVQPTDPTAVAYTRMGGFGLLNLDIDWAVTDTANVSFGIRNVTDRNYSLVDGFPEAGRSVFLTSELRF